MKTPVAIGFCLSLMLVGSPSWVGAANQVPSPPGYQDTNTGEVAHGGHGHDGGHHHGHHDGHHRGWHDGHGHWGGYGWYGGRGYGWGNPGWGLGWGAHSSEEVIDVDPTEVYEETTPPVIVTPPSSTTQYIQSHE